MGFNGNDWRISSTSLISMNNIRLVDGNMHWFAFFKLFSRKSAKISSTFGWTLSSSHQVRVGPAIIYQSEIGIYFPFLAQSGENSKNEIQGKARDLCERPVHQDQNSEHLQHLVIEALIECTHAPLLEALLLANYSRFCHNSLNRKYFRRVFCRWQRLEWRGLVTITWTQWNKGISSTNEKLLRFVYGFIQAHAWAHSVNYTWNTLLNCLCSKTLF